MKKVIFDKTEWDEKIAAYNKASAEDATEYMLLKDTLLRDPRIAYYAYRLQNAELDGYYRRRLEQFLSDSDSDDEGKPNKQLFKIEQDFITDMKRRFCEAEGICWVYVNIGCTIPSCKKKHQLFEPTKKQVIEYFDLFIPKQ